jgi:large subunit ribosomal protein L35
MKLKTRKTIAKRIKVSAKGKVLKRKNGQGHFNSRESSTVTRNKRRDVSMSETYTRNLKQMLPYSSN